MLGHFISTTSTGCIDETLRVCDLITFDGSWNWQQLETLLPRPVLDCIAVVLPPSQDASFDKIIWQWSIAGRFTSSRTYKQFVGRRNMSLLMARWFGKSVHHKEERVKRGMTDDAHYVICGENVETTIHVVRDCKFAAMVWRVVETSSNSTNMILTYRAWTLRLNNYKCKDCLMYNTFL
ncbi:hypothetical protein J1N35_032171 [Gossypium stocksii]|uniref:Reverse transcriptase zinc-binding domain-containing protein n=1 Tax=Gossypium stocksii TaxID=47602 RepID=A0A9D3V3X8_9ROSI|nr:hypothetical protein J1N35_032171 [Gossypium stocksii]